ncbi:TcpQ domain-containing protein [Castellaniella sp.]|uniref:TcpQ domain-containing protein n=1 Tax=Castellaniella sp. TaxID=1955812 RepID=UPI003C714341
MVRVLGMVGLVLGLAGCVATDAGGGWRAWAGLGPSPGRYHFDWRLSGDADLAPLQVFDDGRDTWLQYPAGQTAPALFERSAAGDRLLRARREGDYLVLRGVPDHLLMRGGLLQAEARRVAGGASGGATDDAGAGSSGPETEPAGVPRPGPALPMDTVGVPGIPVPAAPSAQAAVVPVAARPESAGTPAVTARQLSAKPAVPVSHAFEVTPADGNVRRALARWAGLAGWTFEAEHWAVDVDIPLAGSAVFDHAFRPAVRGLLAATELGDRPLQPCFYANQVLRVVPLAQRCDRTQAPGGES